MSDSDGSSESMGISDARLEKALRDAVEKTFKSDPEQLTVKRLRIKVEQELDLDDGFFKNNATWNTRSKEVIQSEVLAQEVNQPPSSQPAPASSPAKEREQPTKGRKAVNKKKRSSASNEGPAKRRKKSLSEEDISADGEDSPPELGAKDPGVPQPASSSSLSDVDGKDEKGPERKEGAEKTAVDGQGQASESEMSELIDEEPKSKKKTGKASSKKSSSKKKESSKPSKAPQQPADPDSEEIKRLQGWLVKCGIRKMWFRELAPYNTPKAKIRHLKEMLSEAGMTGRYSQEKATQIREERELKADIEAVQAGAKHWGKAESGEEEEGRPRRRVARGLQELDFLKDDDGDESD
ncbi:MAG: hypothetical protein Q9208_001696 [Pyrenodesmia sp. 3 TL-2023]